MANEKKVTFGIPSIKKQTPMFIKWINRIITALVGVYGVILMQSGTSIIPENIQQLINPYIITIPAISLNLSKLFGWDYSDKADTDNP